MGKKRLWRNCVVKIVSKAHCSWSENFCNNPLEQSCEFVQSIILFAWDGLMLPSIGVDSVCLSVRLRVPLDTCVCVCISVPFSLFCVVMSLKLWQMDVHASRCVSHFVQLLKHVVSLTEIYECHCSARLYIVTADGSHGQYMLVWKMD